MRPREGCRVVSGLAGRAGAAPTQGLFVTYWGQNVLYHNNGDGTFTDVTEKAGLIQPGPHVRWNVACCFLDFDLDGHLDLFVANYVNFDPNIVPAPGADPLCRYYGVSVAWGPQGLGGGTKYPLP